MPTGCWCVVVLVVCWCVGVLVRWCVGVWLLCDASMHGASTQPKLKVLPHAYRVLVCWCVVVLVCVCVGVLVCTGHPPSPNWCVGVLVCWCVVVLVCWCMVMCDASVRRVSTQPKLTVLPHA